MYNCVVGEYFVEIIPHFLFWPMYFPMIFKG